METKLVVGIGQFKVTANKVETFMTTHELVHLDISKPNFMTDKLT